MPSRWYPACLAGLQEGVYPSMPCRFSGPYSGGSLRGLAGGIFRHTPGGCVFQHALRQTPPHTHTPDGYCCGQYASYWCFFPCVRFKIKTEKTTVNSIRLALVFKISNHNHCFQKNLKVNFLDFTDFGKSSKRSILV